MSQPLRKVSRRLIPAALMNDWFLKRESMCSAQRPSPLGPVNGQGTWYETLGDGFRAGWLVAA